MTAAADVREKVILKPWLGLPQSKWEIVCKNISPKTWYLVILMDREQEH